MSGDFRVFFAHDGGSWGPGARLGAFFAMSMGRLTGPHMDRLSFITTTTGMKHVIPKYIPTWTSADHHLGFRIKLYVDDHRQVNPSHCRLPVPAHPRLVVSREPSRTLPQPCHTVSYSISRTVNTLPAI